MYRLSFSVIDLLFFKFRIVGLLFIYQQILIQKKLEQAYFKAFLNNQWVGFIILGILFSYL